MKIDKIRGWAELNHEAKHWIKDETHADVVTCKLSPRNCKIAPGSLGKCGVRGNVDGVLKTFNYGRSVEATQEIIETEAVYHYSPGAKILSLGNVGCMMSCDFCQNWKTSQIKHLNPRDVKSYSPEDVIKTCIESGINIISWTYNDPVVWHEFVVETSRLAQRHNIKTLYKSALYIEAEPLDELIDCIDIFSISLKSMDEKFYHRHTGGAHLQPVLDRIIQIHKSERHLEVSQLLVTGRNDNEVAINKTNQWVLENLSEDVPLHYVAFHPSYLYVDTERTSRQIMLRAQEMAHKAGINYCYLGNLTMAGVSDTLCKKCGNVLVERYGLRASVSGITSSNRCKQCNHPTDIKYVFDNKPRTEGINTILQKDQKAVSFKWNDEVKSVHIELIFNTDASTGNSLPQSSVIVDRINVANSSCEHFIGGVLKRIIVSKEYEQETGINISYDSLMELKLYPILDRAHFPTSTDLEEELKGFKEMRTLQKVK